MSAWWLLVVVQVHRGHDQHQVCLRLSDKTALNPEANELKVWVCNLTLGRVTLSPPQIVDAYFLTESLVGKCLQFRIKREACSGVSFMTALKNCWSQNFKTKNTRSQCQHVTWSYSSPLPHHQSLPVGNSSRGEASPAQTSPYKIPYITILLTQRYTY